MNCVFLLGVEFNAMGIKRVSFSSKHAYSCVTKGGFSFIRGSASKERATGAGIDSYILAHRGVVQKLGGSNDVFTFLIYPSRSKLSTPKGSQRVCTGS